MTAEALYEKFRALSWTRKSKICKEFQIGEAQLRNIAKKRSHNPDVEERILQQYIELKELEHKAMSL